MDERETATQHQRAECRRLGDELDDLYRRAGIFEAVERANEGPLIPFGVFEKHAPSGTREAREQNEDYFDDQYDYARRHIRDLCFGVPDVELRKNIIAAHRDLISAARILSEVQLQHRHADVRAAEARTDRLPWEWAAVIATLSVAAGYWLFNVAGAIGGAVFGFFMGQGTIANSKARAKADLAYAKEQLANEQEDFDEERRRPDYFSLEEELTGERESAVDLESAMASRAQQRALVVAQP